MNIIVIIVFLTSKSLSIVLDIPFNPVDESYFKITKVGVNPNLILEEYGIAHGYIFYESNDHNFINRVTYLGNEIFNDGEYRERSFRRLVSYGDMGNAVTVSIYSGSEEIELESILYITKAIVYDLKEARKVFRIKRDPLIPESEKPSLKSICYELNKLKPENYVEEVSRLTKKEVTMGEKQIERELDKIFRIIIVRALAKKLVEGMNT
ncbi:conserved hypothetical protein [Theileria orientalis strain Shintoku]|uniref:Uncharacterized protein n=1 Tax=Theileria orientalis strain Shintoku TaxID=869250 RepID=J4D8V3_THEOR|nr:conserved hypothetical protein [Theileria orientalis strain Shintoku]PVC50635.1 hypothetical protein MACL_00002130 [Theileria orientalis]BAM41025.1 conserved hypothetical protein [Theileria orientalis strain Shintoku]|eukprot:XP_009691326.1 conserved hypothetical protein [Theileria orientalis strain Shintoku]